MDVLMSVILGGGIVAVTVLLTKHVTPLVAALIWSYPISLVTSYLIVSFSDLNKAHSLLFETAKYSGFGVIFMWIWYLFTIYKHSEFVSFSCATIWHLLTIFFVNKYYSNDYYIIK